MSCGYDRLQVFVSGFIDRNSQLCALCGELHSAHKPASEAAMIAAAAAEKLVDDAFNSHDTEQQPLLSTLVVANADDQKSKMSQHIDSSDMKKSKNMVNVASVVDIKWVYYDQTGT